MTRRRSPRPRPLWAPEYRWRLAGALLLVAPIGVSVRLFRQTDTLLTAWAVAAGLSALTYVVLRADKRRAERGDRRVPEKTLHLLELLGGWPGSWWAQRRWRHKLAKASYQVRFWSIVLVHQALAIDFLLHWRMARALARWWGLN